MAVAAGVVVGAEGVVVVAAGVQVRRPHSRSLTSTLLLTVCRVSSKLGLCSSTLHWSSTLLCF